LSVRNCRVRGGKVLYQTWVDRLWWVTY
jgi:hypothetical protein